MQRLLSLRVEGRGGQFSRKKHCLEDVEITAPHVCIVMKRPPEPMHISRNIGNYPPKESLSSALWSRVGKGPVSERRAHSGLSEGRLGSFTQMEDNCVRVELL